MQYAEQMCRIAAANSDVCKSSIIMQKLKLALKFIVVMFIAGVTLGMLAVATIYFMVKPDLPSVEVLKDIRLQTPLRIYTQDGQLIGQYGVKRRIPMAIDEVPTRLVNAILATEDSRFYEHDGIDPIGMTRALVNLVITGQKGQGGSTLTMQLARGFFLSREKTYIRKVKEIFIAWHIEQTLNKDEILELYINKVELGHRAFGFGAAAQVYYGKTLNELTLAQIATLAGLPQAPSVLNPISRPERSVERRKIVLYRMLDEGYISQEEYTLAKNAPVTAQKHGAELDLAAPYLADLVYNEMVELYGKEIAETAGFKVYTTAPASLQHAAQNAVRQNMHDYDERHGYRGPITTINELRDAEQMVDTLPTSTVPLEPLTSEESSLESVIQDGDLELLDNVDAVAPLKVALVTQVNERDISVRLAGTGEDIKIDWSGLAWARPYINDHRQGPIPETASDIVQVGDVVNVRETEAKQWSLSQLPTVGAAFVALDPNDGAVRAVVGGYNFYASQFNRATQAKRQVGSNIKPFIYSAALESGYTLASVINDAPINQWDASSGVAWRPQNSPAVYDGPIRMRVALGKSKNVVSVRLLRAIGIENAARYLAKFGFQLDDIPRDETLSLGSGSHTPLEVANGLAVFVNGGHAVKPYFIERITSNEDELIWEAKPLLACSECGATIDTNDPLAIPKMDYTRQASQVISAQNAFLVTEMMRTAVRANGSWNNKTYWLGTGWRARNLLQRTDIGGKTGTTNDARDTWFSGFAPGLVATSWLGFDDSNRQLGRTTRNQHLVNMNPDRFNWIGNGMFGAEDGAKGAQPAWIYFMQSALQDVPSQPVTIPAGITQVRVDRATGKLTPRNDHTALFEYFALGTEPTVSLRSDQVIDPLEQKKSTEFDEGDDIF